MTAEQYLISRFGAYRGHYEWRALEAAFNAGARHGKAQATGAKECPIAIDYIVPVSKPRARKTDPQTSHDAAALVYMRDSAKMRFSIREWLHLKGAKTCSELAIYMNTDKVRVGKRIGEVDGIAPTGEQRNGERVWALI